MYEQPCTQVPLTEFRNDLTEILDRLDESGPVRVMRHSSPIAEIRSASPEGDRRYAKAILDALGYLEELDTGLAWNLATVGVDTLAALTELAQRHKELVDGGVEFNAYPAHCLPEEGPITVDEALARFYFGDDYPKGGTEPYDWFLACAQIQMEAKKRGMKTALPQPNGYDETKPTFVELAVASGHTPQTLVEFATQAIGQGVQPERLAEMFGQEPIPADVLALPYYSEHGFEELVRVGLPHAEAVAVFRMNLDIGLALDFATAGVRSAEEIWRLIRDKVNSGLAVRAARDGLTPEEWKVQVPKVQHLKYRGVGRRFGSEEPGVLPFRLLVQAAEEKVSLVRWDSNSLRVSADQTNRFFHADSAKRQTMYPWVFVYPDRVLDLARARITPSFITAFGKLMDHHFNDGTAPEGFADLAIQAHELGLTTDMANVMAAGRETKRIRFTPEQLIAVLKEGLADVGTAHYLANRYFKPAEWVDYLRQRRERQLMTNTFIATVENTETWGAVRAAAQAMQGLIKGRLLGDATPYLKGVVEKFLAGGTLNDHELLTLLVKTAYAFGDRSYLPKAWREEYEKFAEPVRQLTKNFDEMRGGMTAVE